MLKKNQEMQKKFLPPYIVQNRADWSVCCVFTPPDLKVDKPNTGPPNQPPQSWTAKCFEFVFKAVYFSRECTHAA